MVFSKLVNPSGWDGFHSLPIDFGDKVKGDEHSRGYQYYYGDKQDIVDVHNSPRFPDLGLFDGINQQPAQKSSQSANESEDISGGNDISLSDFHWLTSSSSDKANLIHSYATSKLKKLTSNFTSEGTTTANPTVPRSNPLAISKNKFANPFDCSEFNVACIGETLSTESSPVNGSWPAMNRACFGSG